MYGHASITESSVPLVKLDFRILFESTPDPYLVWTPALIIVAATDAYLQASMTSCKEILGRHPFDVFRDNSNDATVTGVSNLRAYLKRGLQHRSSDVMTEHLLPAVKDIIERKQAKEERRMGDELLEAINKDLEDFYYSVSYDLCALQHHISRFAH